MKNNFLKFILIILVGMAVFIACQKEILDFVDPGDFSIEQAKSWFIKQNPEFIDLGSTNQKGMTIVAKPDWDIASRGKDIGYNYVETDLRTSSSVILMDDQTKKDWANVTKYEGMYASITRLVIRQNKKDKSIESYIMNMVPTKDWLVNNQERLKETHYYDLPNDYSGMIFINDMKGQFTNGWKYTAGKRTHNVTQNTGKSTKNSKEDCDTYLLWELFGNCASYYSCGEIVLDCNYYWAELVGSYMVCYYSEGEEGSPLGGTTGGDSPNVSAISSSSSTLDPTQTSLLEAALTQFRNFCDLFGKIWNVLTNNQVKIKFYMNPDLPHAAATYPNGDIAFKNNSDITIFNTEEELVHRYLQVTEGPTYNPLIKNCEFAAKVYQDYCSAYLGAHSDNYAYTFKGSQYLPTSIQSDYDSWILRMAYGEDFSIQVFNSFAGQFAYPDSPEGSYYDPNYIPQTLINDINGN
ncbi:MAG TPA: hypothetical protein VHO50_10530 [Bacteroidales bacterium]|nr:hypothetical protein [Bacteroidales bacterium]